MDSRWFAYATALIVFALDRLTKRIIESELSALDTLVVIPGFFNLIHTRNPGAAFSLLAGANPEWRNLVLVGVSLAAMVLVVSLLWHSSSGRLGESRGLRLGLSFILGGALGNVYDRLANGAVTDFLEFYIGPYRWPAFNVADSAITIGAALVILDMWRSRSVPQRT